MDNDNALTKWQAQLSDLTLPILENSRQSIEELGPLEDLSLARISNVVLTDPGLTLAILRQASEKPHRHLQGEVHTIDTAVIMLGMRETANALENLPVIEKCIDQATLQIYMQIVNRNYHSAYQAYGMARYRADISPEEIFTASMFQEIGTLMLLVHGDGLLAQHDLYDNLNNEAMQIERLGFSLRQLSNQLADQWGLSSFIRQSLAPIDEPINNPRLYEIDLAHRLGVIAEDGWETPEMEELIDEVASHLHIKPEDALLEISDNAIQSADETAFYGVTPAAASLPTNDKKTDANEPKAIQADETPQITPVAATARVNPTEQTPQSQPQPQSPLNNDVLDEVFSHLDKLISGQVALDQLMAALKTGFQQGLGANRAFFAMVNKEQKQMITRYVFGSDKGFRNLRIPLTHNNLFQRLLEKPQPLWANDDNRNNVIPLIPKEFYKLIDTNHFFISSIKVKNKVLGVVYIDRYGNDFGLDKVTYEMFKKLCHYLAKGLEQLSR